MPPSCLRGWCSRSKSPFSEQHMGPGREGRLIPSLALCWPPTLCKYNPSKSILSWAGKDLLCGQLCQVLLGRVAATSRLKCHPLHLTLRLPCRPCLNSTTKKSFFPFHLNFGSVFLRNLTRWLCLSDQTQPLYPIWHFGFWKLNHFSTTSLMWATDLESCLVCSMSLNKGG